MCQFYQKYTVLTDVIHCEEGQKLYAVMEAAKKLYLEYPSHLDDSKDMELSTAFRDATAAYENHLIASKGMRSF